MLILIWSLLPAQLAGSDPWADEVIEASSSLDGSGLYNDPAAVLGEPTRTFVDPFSGLVYRASIVAAPVNRDEQGRKTLLTLRRGEFVKVRFDEPVEDDPRNPFGIDLLVFGNAFFPADQSIEPDTDMESVTLIGGAYRERVTVAVSASGIGDPQSNPDEWYAYEAGPFGDGLFPTSAYVWDSCAHDWGPPADYTRPVDPGLADEDFIGRSAAEGMAFYGRSGGGTGFDLAVSGFGWIQYVYLTGLGGEADALADVSPDPHGSGDTDQDGDADLADFARLQRCWTGRDGNIGPCECLTSDLDADADVDLDDYVLLHDGLSGPR